MSGAYEELSIQVTQRAATSALLEEWLEFALGDLRPRIRHPRANRVRSSAGASVNVRASFICSDSRLANGVVGDACTEPLTVRRVQLRGKG